MIYIYEVPYRYRVPLNRHPGKCLQYIIYSNFILNNIFIFDREKLYKYSYLISQTTMLSSTNGTRKMFQGRVIGIGWTG
jgi:hypothetical protein